LAISGGFEKFSLRFNMAYESMRFGISNIVDSTSHIIKRSSCINKSRELYILIIIIIIIAMTMFMVLSS